MLTHFQNGGPLRRRVLSAIFDKFFLLFWDWRSIPIFFSFRLCLVGMLMLSEMEQDGLWRPIYTFSGG
jgi:hypothetical protein